MSSSNGTKCGTGCPIDPFYKIDKNHQKQYTKCDTGSGFCIADLGPSPLERNCADIGGWLNSDGTQCMCAIDSVYSVTNGQCEYAKCQPANLGYYYTSCENGGPCINYKCIDPSKPVGWDEICNVPDSFTDNCMSYFNGACKSSKEMGIDDVSPFDTITTSVPDPPNITLGTLCFSGSDAICTGGDTYDLTSDLLLDTILTRKMSPDVPRLNITCQSDTSLNIPAMGGSGTGTQCYFNSLVQDTSTPPGVFLTGIGTTQFGGGDTSVLTFYMNDGSDNEIKYAAPNLGNYPRQSGLFVMFANATNNGWLTPNMCALDIGDEYSPCATMGAGMRCLPGTKPVQVSSCCGDNTVCTNNWNQISAVLPSDVTLLSNDDGSPTLFSVWACSADAAVTATKFNGTLCQAGFNEDIIWDNSTGGPTSQTYTGTCVRTEEYNNQPNSTNGLAWNYCDHSQLRVDYCMTVPENAGICQATSGERAMCWDSVCQSPGADKKGLVAYDQIPYIPQSYGYVSITDGQLKVCNASDKTIYAVTGVPNNGCSNDLQRHRYAECTGEGSFVGECHGSDTDKTWQTG